MIVFSCFVGIARECYLSASHRARQEELWEKLQTEYAGTENGEGDGENNKEKNKEEKGEDVSYGISIFGQKMENALSAMYGEISGSSLAEGGDGLETEPVLLHKYAGLYEENPDLIGWLSIEGMEISYPVMQCSDDEYYLHHDFYGNEDKYGCLYVRARADVNTPGTNFLIYGHNMRDGSMFGDLDFYKEEAFFKEHSMISFDTLYEERTYEIVAVFLSRVYKEDDEVFKYYDFYEAGTPEEFWDFYENIKSMSLYDTGVTAEYGDTFITLSTCAYHVEDGRLAVVAKRIK